MIFPAAPVRAYRVKQFLTGVTTNAELRIGSDVAKEVNTACSCTHGPR